MVYTIYRKISLSAKLSLPLAFQMIDFHFLFEQMGKFYELFEMDAHIGAKELDLQYMKVCLSLKALSILISFQ